MLFYQKIYLTIILSFSFQQPKLNSGAPIDANESSCRSTAPPPQRSKKVLRKAKARAYILRISCTYT